MTSTTPLRRGWAAVRLGDIGRWFGGGTPSKFEPRFWTDGHIPWVSPKDMKVLRINGSEDRITDAATTETNVKPFPVGTVLIVIRSGILSRTLPVGVAEVPGTMNQDLKGVMPSSGVTPMFLAYQLIGREMEVLKRCSKHGTTVASIDTERLHGFTIRVAPLPEQHRIVAKIEELFSDLDAGVAALTRVRAKLKRYRASVLKAAVEGRLTAAWRAAHPDVEPAEKLLERILTERRAKWEAEQLRKYAEKGKEPPKGWKTEYTAPPAPSLSGQEASPLGWTWATLSQLGSVDRGRSRHRPRNASHLYGGPYPFVQTGEIGRANTFIRSYTQTYSEAGLAQSRLWPRDTLCITIAANIAETAILDFEACFPDSVVGFLPRCATVSVRYIELYIRTIQADLEHWAPATAQKNINLNTLQHVAIRLPSAAEQQEVVLEVDRRLSVVDAVDAEVEHALRRAGRLRQSILKRAFEGGLVPQDPNDEPAEKLLERLQAERDADAKTEPAKKTATKRRGRKKART